MKPTQTVLRDNNGIPSPQVLASQYAFCNMTNYSANLPKED
jgi:hypothetical protein